jgi:hypothetical protein
MTVEDFADGAAFLAFVQEVLVSQLRPGQVVVLDNLKAHKVAGVREAIEAVGARLLYLPPRLAGLLPQRGVLVQKQGDVAAEGGTDAGEPSAGDHGGIGGDHEPGCSGLVDACWLSCSIQLKSAVRKNIVPNAIREQ